MSWLRSMVDRSSEGLAPIWMLYQDGQEFGPFSASEIINMVNDQRVSSLALLGKVMAYDKPQPMKAVFREIQASAALEKRKGSTRVDFSAEVILVDQEVLIYGQCVDLSASGLLVELPTNHFKVGATLNVIIKKSSALNVAISQKARVVRRTESGFGLEFSSPNARLATIIEKYVTAVKDLAWPAPRRLAASAS